MQANDHNVSPVQTYVAGRMIELRKQRGLSQLDLASNCGMSTNQIGTMEREQRNVRIATLFTVVSSLNISMAEFFKDFN